MRFYYPRGKRKAITFSYDDGQIYDRNLISILNQYHLKGTFHINSGNLYQENADSIYLNAEELKELFKGHEIAVHGVEHRNLPTITRNQMVVELEEDRKALEKLSCQFVQGMSYAFGNYSEEAIEVAKSLGIKYSRTVESHQGFFPPVDFMRWHPTCHHNCSNLMDLGKRFLDIQGFYELPLMYVWGHSFEFHNDQNWAVIEEFADLISHKDDIWYATNLEICDYILAVRMQEISADGTLIKNPTAITIYYELNGEIIALAPGEIKNIA